VGLPPQVGAYRLTGELGRGAMGVVYRGLAPEGREVAVKVLNPANLSATGAARFEREARLSQELVHPNLIRVYESGVHGGQRYLVMELVPGVSLEETLRRGPLPPAEVRALGQALCAGLAAAHARGVLHRDLKPANVLMGLDRIVLTDFGLALDASEDRERLTKTGVLLGSPAYMAPEQIEGKSPLVGPRTDVYGLGATLYEAMTGQPPFSAPSLLEIAVKVTEGRPPSPLKLNPEADPRLAEVCLRCLASDPADRYGSVEEVARDLEAAGSGGGRRGRIGAGLALILVPILGWLGFVAWSELRPTPQSQVTPSPSPEASPRPSPAASTSPSQAGPDAHALADKGDVLGALAALGEDRRDLALRAELLFWRSSKLYFERGNGSRAAIKEALRANPGDPFLAALHHHAWRDNPLPEGSPPRPRRGLPGALLTAWDLADKGSRDLDHLRRIYNAFERAYELDPRNRWVHLGRVRFLGEVAKVSQAQADFSRARRLAREAHEAWPQDPLLTWRVAWTYKIEGEVLINDRRTRPRALELLQRSVVHMNEVGEREPKWAYLPLERGYTKFLISKLTRAQNTAQEALSDLEQATRLRPNNAHAHFTLGLVRQDFGLLDAAAQAYREAIRKDLNVVSYYLRLTTVYLKLGKVEEAHHLLSTAIDRPTLSARDRATLRQTQSKLPPL